MLFDPTNDHVKIVDPTLYSPAPKSSNTADEHNSTI